MISKLEDLLEYISTEHMVYFRGQNNGIQDNWKLEPSFMRKNQFSTFTKYDELDLIHTISEKEPQYFSGCNDIIDNINIMQHYGFPTRILDLTTDPLVALFFSLDKTNLKIDDPFNPVIYVFTPLKIKKSSSTLFSNILNDFYSESEKEFESIYLVNGKNDHIRIRNQSGDFLFFLENVDIMKCQNLIRVEEVKINLNSVSDLNLTLNKLNYTRNKIYPGLENYLMEYSNNIIKNKSIDVIGDLFSNTGNKIEEMIPKVVDEVSRKTDKPEGNYTIEYIESLYYKGDIERIFIDNHDDKDVIAAILRKLESDKLIYIKWINEIPAYIIFKHK